MTLYVVFTAGDAVGLEILVALNPVPGAQLYESVPVPPVPVVGVPPITTLNPAQTESTVPALADTAGLMVSIIESTEVHPDTLSVTDILYVVVPATIDVIVGLATDVPLRLVDGDQAYVKLPDPPVAVGEPPRVIVPDTGIQKV